DDLLVILGSSRANGIGSLGVTNDCLHALRTFLADWPVGQRYAQALSACFLAPAQVITAPPVHPEPSWWRGHSPYAVAVIVLIVFVSVAQVPAGYLLAPPGLHFTGAPTYAEDVSVHELYAAQMAAHLRYQNLMTPEPTPRGWFFHPLDAVMGLAQKATGIPFMALVSAVALACAPALAFGLMTMARRARLRRPRAVARHAPARGTL